MAFPKTLPKARVLDQTRVPRLRWGICGPGWIAERFVASLKGHTRQELLAVQSTDPNRAKAFAEKADIKKSYGGYDMIGDQMSMSSMSRPSIRDISLTLSLRSRQESTFSLRNRWR